MSHSIECQELSVRVASQPYPFEKSIEWNEPPEEGQQGPEIQDGFVISPSELAQRKENTNIAFTQSLIPSVQHIGLTLMFL